MAQGKVLLVDDEPKIVAVLKAYLEREGFQVLTASDGTTALELARSQRPDLLLLDLMLPGLDGWEVCRTLRRDSGVPIIMLTARGEAEDRVAGLELGADDYVAKPFSPREVVARVKAVLRRAAATPEEGRFTCGDLVVDPTTFKATYSGRSLELTPTEFRLLAALARRPGRVFTRAELLDEAQGTTYEGYERTIDTHIKNLRRKLEAAGAVSRPCTVATVHGVGYRLEVGQGE
jgi:DNA-binding response OmpR family regulator